MPSLRILLADDEPDIRKVGVLALRRLGGFHVVEAASGEEVIARAREEAFDAILLDVSMPGVDGPATLRLLREDPRTAAVPVLFLTARCQPAEVAELMGLGVVAVLAKPFDPVALPEQVRAAVEGAGAERPA